MAPKVAFVTPGSFPIPSGKSSSVERVIEKFVPLLQPHAEPRIYGRSTRGLARFGIVKGVRCERFNASNKKNYVAAISRRVATFSPSCIQVDNRPLYVLTLRRLFPHKRIWLSLHSSTFIGGKYISQATLRKCFRAADKIIVNSEFLMQVVARKAPETRSKLSVVYPGVEPDRFPSRFSDEGMSLRSMLRERKGLSGKKVVIFIGRLIPLKGVHHLLRVAPRLAKLQPELLIIIVGSPFYGSHRTTAYSRRLQALGRSCPANVRFVPYVPYSEVPNWFIAADIAVVPSGAREAFGLVNVEAMACGLPVVATRSGGMKEIIVDGETGFLIDPNRVQSELFNKLLLLLQNNELRDTMGQASRSRIEQNFTWQHTADRWLSLFKDG
ncbi:glycosyltransferase family 4 protein [Paenibacillus sp. NEAU-GSW1]|uniref:glycosyltransferase family 4 protein n=1 Tax=Paenibacillus sp. NEAU-GSW1 TaxID=2682486 RepID=UPI0012E2A71C|nr:glycosyltransferase family 4 protein [Paenibacillus sp. NEAU-GSW1]MUT65869.1 glycosyltransferase [Paenibacillus sp. NEAU-GSW1]